VVGTSRALQKVGQYNNEGCFFVGLHCNEVKATPGPPLARSCSVCDGAPVRCYSFTAIGGPTELLTGPSNSPPREPAATAPCKLAARRRSCQSTTVDEQALAAVPSWSTLVAWRAAVVSSPARPTTRPPAGPPARLRPSTCPPPHSGPVGRLVAGGWLPAPTLSPFRGNRKGHKLPIGVDVSQCTPPLLAILCCRIYWR